MQLSTSAIDELLSRGVAECIDTEHLRERLASGKVLRIKLGIDPTSPNLHLGRAIPLLKLRDFQRLGHQIIFLVGDFTGVIGDTSDKDSERPMLSREVLTENMKTYTEQAGKIIDLEKTEIVYNSTWLGALGFAEIGELTDQFSVADFIARDNIKRRLDAGKRVSLREMLYPVMQGFDSVSIKADVELGGTDQRFNLLAGRILQKHTGQEPQDILMTELIPGTDGRKMSSSWGNTINITDSASDMYGKVMSIPDMLMEQYFVSLTRVPMDTIHQLLSGHPRDAKMYLAREVVGMIHGSSAASQAEAVFVETFQKNEFPADAPSIMAQKGTPLVSLLLNEGFVDSKAEFRRLVESNAVTNITTHEKITDSAFEIVERLRLRIGKHRFIEITTK